MSHKYMITEIFLWDQLIHFELLVSIDPLEIRFTSLSSFSHDLENFVSHQTESPKWPYTAGISLGRRLVQVFQPA